MRLIHRSVLVVAMLSVAVCACDDDDADDVVVESAAASNADFTSYETFAFAQLRDGGTTNVPEDVAVNLENASDAIRSELEDRGLTEVNLDEDPDLIAFSLASTDEETDVFWDCVPGYWYGYWTYSWDPCATVSPQYDTYTVGTLVVGLNDPELEEVVFAGVAEGALLDSDPEDLIDDAVDDIFDDYPADQTGSE